MNRHFLERSCRSSDAIGHLKTAGLYEYQKPLESNRVHGLLIILTPSGKSGQSRPKYPPPGTYPTRGFNPEAPANDWQSIKVWTMYSLKASADHNRQKIDCPDNYQIGCKKLAYLRVSKKVQIQTKQILLLLLRVSI